VQWAANYRHLPLWILHPDKDQKVLPHHAEDMYLHALRYGPDRVERTYFPGIHGDRINGPAFADTQLNWLAQFTRRAGDAPQTLDFSLDWSGSHFWIKAAFSETSLNEAHWLRVWGALYDRRLRTIEADVENMKPQSGDQYGLGVPSPRNLSVTLTFDLARIGLPTSGTYTIERVNKEDGSFAQEIVTATAGKVSATVPQGGHILKISAGGQPPNTQSISLRQGVDGYAGAQDTHFSFWEPTTNMATKQLLYLRVNGYAPIHTSALRFDLSRVPANARVRFAVLSLGMKDYAASVLPLEVDALARPWNVNEATWLRASASASWTEPGALNVPADRKGTITDTRLIYPSGPVSVADRYGFNVTEMVKGWVADPLSNIGCIFRINLLEGAYGGAKDGFTVSAAEFSTVSRRPQLTIIYTTDEPTPTPSDTATPTATATATPDGGKVTGVVFLDDNSNGVRDGGEAGVAGRLVQINRDGVAPVYTNTGDDGRYTFWPVGPGIWQVLLSAPANSHVTTPGGNPVTVNINGAGPFVVDFGLASGAGTVTPTPTATRTPCASCRNSYLPLILTGSGSN
jgi:hypothetical protein